MLRDTSNIDQLDNGFTRDQIKQLDQIVYFSSALGSLGALFIIITYVLFRDIRSFASKLIFYLSISDLMCAISYLPFGRSSRIACDLQGMGLLFFLTSSYFWTACISISLFLVFFTTQHDLNYLMKYYHYISWGFPLLATLVSLKFDVFYCRSYFTLPIILLFTSFIWFLNCIVYGVTEGFLNRYVEFFEKYLCRCRRSKEYKEIVDADIDNLVVDYSDDDDAVGITNSLNNDPRVIPPQLRYLKEIDDFVIEEYH
eukprot:gene19135-22916_t